MTTPGEMIKQAQQLQAKMATMQEKLAEMEITGSSAGGMCQMTLNGKGEVRRIKIDPSLVTPADVEVLEDLIVAAHNDAKGKLVDEMRDKISELTGGLQLPLGMQLPF